MIEIKTHIVYDLANIRYIIMSRKHIIKEFSESAGVTIYGQSTVSDDWLNQLKTYKNITIEDKKTAYMWMITIALFVELLASRTEDIVNSRERSTVEKLVIDRVVELIKLVNFRDNKDANKQKDWFYETIAGMIADSRAKQQKEGTSIIDFYQSVFVGSFGDIVPDEFLIEYISFKVKTFESLNFRNRLHDRLNEEETLK